MPSNFVAGALALRSARIIYPCHPISIRDYERVGAGAKRLRLRPELLKWVCFVGGPCTFPRLAISFPVSAWWRI